MSKPVRSAQQFCLVIAGVLFQNMILMLRNVRDLATDSHSSVPYRACQKQALSQILVEAPLMRSETFIFILAINFRSIS